MPVTWHPKRGWNFGLSEDEKKETGLILLSNALNVYNLRAFEHFEHFSLEIFVNI